ncbi:MAG: ATP-binding cassette domain-containing protein [Verrucomicrobiales bacterium]|nr:ATP-binding cassette domain-containing protein [Verrucomicrobiales bacterium]
MTSETPLISVEDISFAYEEKKVVIRDVSLRIFPGRKYAFVGPNGAGKTTLANLLAGTLTPQTGRISYREDMRIEGGQISLAYVRQQLSLFHSLTVAQHFRLGTSLSARPIASVREHHYMISECLKQVGAPFGPKDIVGDLAFAQRQLLEIALALWRKTKVLILDEPTSALDSSSANLLFETLGRLSNSGVAIILISHSPTEIQRLDATVLTLGSEEARIDRWPDVTHDHAAPANTTAETASASLQISHTRRKQNYVVPLRKGEASILVFDDAFWRAKTWLAAAEQENNDAIEVLLDTHGRLTSLRNGNHRIRHVSSDRERFGLFTLLSVWRNYALLSRTRDVFTARGVAKRLDSIISRYSIVMPSWHHPISTLSGGNQQKLILASVLESDPEVLIAEEFLLGLDHQAQQAALQRLRDYLSGGGIVVILTCFPTGYAALSSQITEIPCSDWSA